MSDRGKVNRKLVNTVDLDEIIHDFLVVGGDGADTKIDALSGHVEVLTDVAGIERDDLDRRHAVPPFHTPGDRRPDEGNGRFGHKNLATDAFV